VAPFNPGEPVCPVKPFKINKKCNCYYYNFFLF
jgi:hypothetical protein